MKIIDCKLPGAVEEVVDLLRGGNLVAIPTETVYGLAADASNESAVRRIFSVKGRPTSHPLILHVSDITRARSVVRNWNETADRLARVFWPGAVSLLLERSDLVPAVVTGGRSTVVVRVPDHDTTLRILHGLHRAGSIGLAAPSANKFGAVSPTDAAHVEADMGPMIDAVLDGGPCRIGVESTIIDCRDGGAKILREGGVPFEAIRDALAPLGIEPSRSGSSTAIANSTDRIAPGMLQSHYAPRARVEVFESDDLARTRASELEIRGSRIAMLPHPQSTREYSQNLFRMLRECDEQGVDVILAVLPGPEDLGSAIRDRLLKASAQR